MLILAEVSERLLEKDVLVPLVIGGSIVLVVLFKTIAGVIRSVSRERTRREIAAFIAEGSMTPEQGERLMKAGREAGQPGCGA
ncbi:MAG: hypothetical protein IT436_16730 [Phycisphaerales bacterium]|nr:hypothetical protein [Phycisphaerales bacterium]